jgi:tetratricopeptide (TPR) repeat protein
MAMDRGRQPVRIGLPLADLIQQAMARQSLTLGDVARLVQAAGASSATPSLVCNWRRGKFTPLQHNVRLLAKALRLPLDVAAQAADAQREMLTGRRAADGSSGRRLTGCDLESYEWSQSGSLHALEDASERAVMDRRSLLPLTGTAVVSLANDWLVPPDQLLAVLRGAQVDGGFVDRIEQGVPRLRLLEAARGGQRTRRLVDAELGVVVEILSNSAYTESVGRRLYSLAAELGRMVGWASFDAGLHSSAQRYWISALHAAHTADNRAIGSNILKSMSLQLYDFGRLTEALVLAQNARHSVGRTTPRTTAMLALREARAHAALRDTTRCEQLIARAEAALARASTADDDPEWVTNYFDDAEYLGQVGTCYLDLEQADRAVTYLSKAVDQLPTSKVRDRATYLIRAAASAALLRDCERAFDLMYQAIPLIQDAPSHRNIQRILSVRSSIAVKTIGTTAEEVDEQLSTFVA